MNKSYKYKTCKPSPLLQSYNILMQQKLQLQKLQLENLQALSSLVHAKELEDVVVAQLKSSSSNSLLP